MLQEALKMGSSIRHGSPPNASALAGAQNGLRFVVQSLLRDPHRSGTMAAGFAVDLGWEAANRRFFFEGNNSQVD